MSKKIIYLLSLLMALSLVFASCKKNGLEDIGGSEPDNGFDDSPTTENGLADSQDWLDQNSEKPIKNDKIPGFQSVGGQAYFRNPVIVVMGDSDVVVFGEKRYKTLGAANDIGIDGNTAVDVVSISSLDSGKKWGAVSIVGRPDGKEATVSDAVASPVVFKIDDTKVVVVASAGVGLSRVNQNYTSRGDGQVSKLMYTVGTYASGNFTWTKWTDITETVTQAITDANIFGTGDGKQFAVHSGKGVVDASKNMYLAVTVSDQGKNGGSKELMGNIMFKSASGTVNWTVVDGSAVKFNSVTGNFSTHKESRVIGVKQDNATAANQIEYIAVGNPWSSPANNKIGYAVGAAQPADNGIAGSEGSPAYLEVANWQGSKSYNPNDYNMTTGTKKRLFAHVKSLNNTITMYALKDDGFVQDGKAYTVQGYPTDTTALAKSSSMDVLGDGTIVMVAEQGGTEKVYNVVFKRFTQKFLATQLGVN